LDDLPSGIAAADHRVCRRSAHYVGTSPLTLLIARELLAGQRGFFLDRPFPLLWAGFLLTASAAIAFEWALVSLLSTMVLGPRSFVFVTVLTVATFPVGSILLTRAQRAFLPDN
jgi:hypothetical protein